MHALRARAVAAAAAAAAAALGGGGVVVMMAAEEREPVKPPLKLLSGSAHPKLAAQIAEQLGVPLGLCATSRFNDGEVSIRLDESVRGADVFIIQPTCSPVNDSLMELLLMVSTARRSSASTITAVVPYFGYKRSVGRPLTKLGGHEQGYDTPVAASEVATMLEVMGVDRVITVEFYPPGHGQTDGFFKEPNTTIDNLEVTDVAVKHFCSKQYERPLVIISPNPEFVQKAHDFARGMRDYAVRFGRPLEVRVALALKPSSASDRMYGSSGNLEILGDVEGCDVVIVDDVIDTGRTLRTTSRRLKECGAERIFVFATHGLFNGDCLRMLDGCAIDEIVVTDTIPAFEANENMPTEKVVRLGVATRLAQAISDVYQRRSIQYLSYREDTDIGRYYGQDSQIDVADVEEDADRVVELGEEEGEGATAQA